MQYVYNDEWDKENEPFTPVHLDKMQQVEKHFKLSANVTCTYFATIHGAIFKFPYPHDRLTGDNIAFLAVLDIRWVECNNGELTIALKH